MEKLGEVLEQNLNENLHQIIISNRRSDELAKKIVLRPFAERGQLMFFPHCIFSRRVPLKSTAL